MLDIGYTTTRFWTRMQKVAILSWWLGPLFISYRINGKAYYTDPATNIHLGIGNLSISIHLR